VNTIEIRPAGSDDAQWVRALLIERWRATQIASRGRLLPADELPAFIAGDADERIGLATYHIDAGQCELVSLDSLRENVGVGTQLVAAVADAARHAGCRRLWLITTNDNLRALGFYQKRGFELVAVHRNALAESRRLKPSIPLIGVDGIPLRDEIELEVRL
jgi:N-acetylglutamate synthase-like GNAT family acetyltransferase